jgi:dihydroorotate dehydrogenase (NAD+) catalytic subunit
MAVDKYDLQLDKTLMNTAGSLGFAPNPPMPVEFGSTGFFVTNPISLLPRAPANPPRMLSFEGGFLLHSGYPNPGIRTAVKRYSRRWARSPIPVLVHLLAETSKSLGECLRILEQVEGVSGVEIGLAPDIDLAMFREIARAAQGELPFILQLPFEAASGLAREAAEHGAAAVSLGPPRGALIGPLEQLVTGRLYGPAVYPLALGVVNRLAAAGIPTIGSGGIYTPEDVKDMLLAGAVTVQLDSVLWRGGFIEEGLNDPAGSSSGHH